MRTYHVFHAARSPGLRGFTDEPQGSALPQEEGPWTLVRRIEPDEDWNLDVSRAVVAAGILENGFFLWGPVHRPKASRPVIESDRVEGTAVYDRDNTQIGTIRRLLIEKVSGRVLCVDVTFGGIFGVGSHHRTIPWDALTYDPEIEGYRTEMTPEQVRELPAVAGEVQV